MRWYIVAMIAILSAVELPTAVAGSSSTSSNVVLELDRGQEPQIVEAIAKNPKMRSLLVSGPVHCEWMRSLGRCESLESIELQSVSVADSDVEHLRRIKCLRRITVVGPTPLTTNGTAAIAKCPNVEELSLSYVPLSSKTIAEIGRMEHLRRLALASRRLEGWSLGNLSLSKSIKELELAIWEADVIDLEFLKGMEQIEEVSLSYFAGSTLVLSAMPVCPRLRSVRLYEVSVDSSSFKSLSRQPSLQKLTIDEIDVDQGCIDGIASCNSLKVLRISSANSDVILSWGPFKKLGNLQELHLTGVAIQDADVQFLQECKHLRRLKLPYCRGLTDKGIQEIAKLCPSLEELDIDGTSISIETFRRLFGLDRLVKLSVRNSRLNAREVEAEVKMRPHVKVDR